MKTRVLRLLSIGVLPLLLAGGMVGWPLAGCGDPCQGGFDYRVDSDEDGYDTCSDCNDADPAIHPDATEICDGLDNDCDNLMDDTDTSITGQNTYYADLDQDGFGDPDAARQSCEPIQGYVSNAADCNDFDLNTYPGATEVCDSKDNDCDDLIDDRDTSITGQNTYFSDLDQDGSGDPDAAKQSCEPIQGCVTNAGDCNDADPAIHPGATEVCDDIDNDCDDWIDDQDSSITGQDTSYADLDQDGFGDPDAARQSCDPIGGYVANGGDCNDAADSAYPGATEICDGIDNDCDVLIDAADSEVTGTEPYYTDADGDSFGSRSATAQYACPNAPPAGKATTNTDCNDSNAAMNPGAEEVCNGTDDDCDSKIDLVDDSLVGTAYYVDGDSDTFGKAGSAAVQGCTSSPPSGRVTNAGDCNDADPAIHPGATEVCDDIDNDCDDWIDDQDSSITGQDTSYADLDQDGFGDPDAARQSCDPIEGYVANGEDCNDAASSINPDAPEFEDDVDNNCDDRIDVCPDLSCDGIPDIVVSDLGASNQCAAAIIYWGTDDEDDTFDVSGWCTEGAAGCYGYTNEHKSLLNINSSLSNAIEDFNRDGVLDIAFTTSLGACAEGANTLTILYGKLQPGAFDGNETWTEDSRIEIGLPSGEVQLQVLDINNDLYSDIMVSYYTGNDTSTVQIFWSSGPDSDPQFSNTPKTATRLTSSALSQLPTTIIAACAGDLDGDTVPDLLLPASGILYWGTVEVDEEGRHVWGYDLPPTQDPLLSGLSCLIDDVNLDANQDNDSDGIVDGGNDIVLTDLAGDATLYLNQGERSLASFDARLLDTGNRRSVDITSPETSFGGDPYPDILLGSSVGNSGVSLRFQWDCIGDGCGLLDFTEQDFSWGGSALSIADFNGDDLPDFLHAYSGSIYFFLWDPEDGYANPSALRFRQLTGEGLIQPVGVSANVREKSP